MTPGRAARAAALLLGTGLFAGLAHLGVRDTSPTFDEVAHLPAGYTHLTRLDFRLVPEQPPLVKDLAALPLLAMDVRVPEQDAAWARRRPYEFGRRFLFEWNDGQRLAAAGRHAMLACAVLLLGLVAACACWRWGAAVGGVALFLGALHPDLLAHGPLVTSDVPAALVDVRERAALRARARAAGRFRRAGVRAAARSGVRREVLGADPGAAARRPRAREGAAPPATRAARADAGADATRRLGGRMPFAPTSRPTRP
jgi:hypothetical protein